MCIRDRANLTADVDDARQQVREERRLATAQALELETVRAERDEALARARDAQALVAANAETVGQLREDIRDDRESLREERRAGTANFLRLTYAQDEVAALKKQLELARADGAARAAQREADTAAARAATGGDGGDGGIELAKAELDAALLQLREAEEREAALVQAAVDARAELQAELNAARAELQAELNAARAERAVPSRARTPVELASRLERAARLAVGAVGEVMSSEHMSPSEAAVVVRAAVAAALAGEMARLGGAASAPPLSLIHI